jgi:hypothetical protein
VTSMPIHQFEQVAAVFATENPFTSSRGACVRT